jgi:ATP-binding cassette subfamily B multidrug efflux pump
MSNRNNAPRRSGGPMGGPMGGFGGAVEKPKNFKATIKKLSSYLSPFMFAIVMVILLSIASSIFYIWGPKILGEATTKVFEGVISKVSGGSGIDLDALANTLIFLVFLYLISSVFSLIQGFVISGISQKVSYNLRKEISEKINKLPLKYFDEKTHGEVLSRVTNDVDTISMNLNQSVSQIITSIVTVIGVLIMMYSINWIMATTILLVVPLSAVLIMVVVKYSQKYFKSQQEYLGKVNGHVEEMYSGHNIVKAFNQENNSISSFEDLNLTLRTSAWKSQFLSGIIMPMSIFIGNIGYVVVAILGGILASRGTISVGSILSFTQYVNSFNQPISQAAQISSVMQSTAAAAERVFEFLEEKEEEPSQSKVVLSGLKGNVEFENVHFGYDENKIIINNFSSKIKSGMKVAIVGPTGAGKTTIVKLLMRFYELNSGRILIDNNDINDFERNELRSFFGMVLQDTWLFGGTIMENIRYGNLEATDQDVILAAKAAHVHRFVKTLPDGYNMILNEEASNVSQGQKQLLTIARAILSNPKILILDEATSSVDTRTEVLIQKAMTTLMEGRTSFIIAHRLSTIRDADLILVMNNGDIVEQGSHHELINAKGFYWELYNSQFENKE